MVLVRPCRSLTYEKVVNSHPMQLFQVHGSFDFRICGADGCTMNCVSKSRKLSRWLYERALDLLPTGYVYVPRRCVLVIIALSVVGFSGLRSIDHGVRMMGYGGSPKWGGIS